MTARDAGTVARTAIEAALIAAEAMARVEQLERQVAALSHALTLAGHAAGRPDIAAAAAAAIRPDLRLVETEVTR
jgi:hypothetical protein